MNAGLVKEGVQHGSQITSKATQCEVNLGAFFVGRSMCRNAVAMGSSLPPNILGYSPLPPNEITRCKLSVGITEVQPMPSRICCPNNHSIKGISVHDAAIALSEGRALGMCKKCGKEL